jgi:hypothetical protein
MESAFIAVAVFDLNRVLRDVIVAEVELLERGECSAKVCVRAVLTENLEVPADFRVGSEKELPLRMIWQTQELAERKLIAMGASRQRSVLAGTINGEPQFYPKNIEQVQEVSMSSNPLRFGEPMVAFATQANTVSRAENAQKVLQLAGAILEDIDLLWSTLWLLGFANDYAKKLLGKYIIIELNSLFNRLKDLG